MTRIRTVSVIVAVAAFLIAGLGGAPRALAADELTELVMESRQGYFNSRIELTFDNPISINEAVEIRGEFENAITPLVSGSITCGGAIHAYDVNGDIELALSCGASHAFMPWGWKMRPSLRTTVVGLLHEEGMLWSRNNVIKPKLAPHSEYPDYKFHGTLNPMYVGDVIQYVDFFDYEHNIAGGGSARITIFGTLEIKS